MIACKLAGIPVTGIAPQHPEGVIRVVADHRVPPGVAFLIPDGPGDPLVRLATIRATNPNRVGIITGLTP